MLFDDFKIRMKLKLNLYSSKNIDKLSTKKIASLYKTIGYIFKNEELIISALKHRSFLFSNNEKRVSSNERLEFLGDSILNFLVTRYLYINYPNENEGSLSKKKSIIVSGKNLVSIAKKINLGDYILLSNSEDKSGGRKKDSILEDSFEALIGAIFLDGGMNSALVFVRKFVLFKAKEVLSQNIDKNYKSRLLEYVQKYGLNPPIYKVIEERGPEHNKVFSVAVYVQDRYIASGNGYSKKKAEQIASKEALAILHEGDKDLTEIFDI